VEAYSQDGFQLIDTVSVIDRYEDSFDAMKRYKQLHKDQLGKEIYILHTSRPVTLSNCGFDPSHLGFMNPCICKTTNFSDGQGIKMKMLLTIPLF